MFIATRTSHESGRALQSSTARVLREAPNRANARKFAFCLLCLLAPDLHGRSVMCHWPKSKGGNGHVYVVSQFGNGEPGTWHDANSKANGMGGHLATITSGAENEFVAGLTQSAEFWNEGYGPWLGGIQKDESEEPAGGWTWVTDEPWEYRNWDPKQPDNFYDEDGLHFYPGGKSTWNDLPADGHHTKVVIAYVVEFDCSYTDAVDMNDVAFRRLEENGAKKLATGGRDVTGLVADGVTQVLLRSGPHEGAVDVEFKIRDEFESMDERDVGNLRDPLDDGNAPGNPFVVRAHDIGDGRFMAFAVMTAPVDFVRPDHKVADEVRGGIRQSAESARPILVQKRVKAEGEDYAAPCVQLLRLYRPPVALIHGIWSNQYAWKWDLENDDRFTVWPADYEEFHADSFSKNVVKVRRAVGVAVDTMRRSGVAATQADIVGHSMGGVLARLFASSSPDYLRADNFGRGDIHKLITLDTPHNGSPLACLLVDQHNLPTFLGTKFTKLGMCSTCGAVRDFRPDVIELPSCEVVAHAIVGTGGSDLIQEGLEELLSDKLALILWVLRAVGLVPEDLFPASMQHDVIVGRPSQEGGIDETTRFKFDGLDLAVHFGFDAMEPFTSVTRDQRISSRVIELLNASVASSLFSQTGFPERSPTQDDRDLCALLHEAVVEFSESKLGSIIVNLLRSDPVYPGEELTLHVEGEGEFELERVIVTLGTAATFADSPPFEMRITVPIDAIGQIRLNAIGFDGDRKYAIAEERVLDVEIPAELIAISAGPKPMHLFAFAPIEKLAVRGTYDDGVVRDIAGSSLGTSYSSDNPQIASVDADGQVMGWITGTTTVRVQNGALGDTVEVIVDREYARGDMNCDRSVSFDDIDAFILALVRQAEYRLAYPDCDLYNADVNVDGSVDFDDIDGFVACLVNRGCQ